MQALSLGCGIFAGSPSCSESRSQFAVAKEMPEELCVRDLLPFLLLRGAVLSVLLPFELGFR